MNHPMPFAARWRQLSLILFAATLTFSCGVTDRDRHGLSIRDGALHRGDQEFTIRAIEEQSAGDPALDLESKVLTLNRICSAGGNSILLDAGPLENSPLALNPAWTRAFADFTEEVRKRNMSIILRLDSSAIGTAATDPESVARALVGGLPDSWDSLFWFTGPKALDLEKSFRRLSDDFVTAAEGEDAAVQVVNALAPTSPSKPILVASPEGDLPAKPVSFVVAEDPGVYDRLEAFYMPEPGTPVAPAEAGIVTPEEAEEGFTALFDGKTFDGWTITGKPNRWAIENGVIVWKEKGGGYVQTRRKFSDFILRVDWRIAKPAGNSGIHLRAPLAGRGSRIGMEFQLLGDTGEEPHKNGTGSIYDVKAPLLNASNPVGEWNTAEIICDGSHFKATLNGQLIQDVDLDSDPELRVRLRRGFIALQDHGDPVEFKNIRLKELEDPADS